MYCFYFQQNGNAPAQKNKILPNFIIAENNNQQHFYMNQQQQQILKVQHPHYLTEPSCFISQ